MKKLLLSVLCLGLTAGFLTSCSKDDEAKASRTEMLAGSASKQWKITDLLVANQSVYSTAFPACTQDNTTIFYTTKKVELTSGAASCGVVTPTDMVGEGTWSFNSDETVLTFSGSGKTYTGTVKEISSSKLVLEGDFLGLGYPVSLVFTAQ